MKLVKLPSGQKSQPRKIRDIYKNKDEFFNYSETYGIARRLNSTAELLWEQNPYIVSSVIPSDLALYNVTDSFAGQMKIIELKLEDKLEDRYYCKVLFYGKEWEFRAKGLAKVKNKILERCNHTSLEEINVDITLNYPDILEISEKNHPQA